MNVAATGETLELSSSGSSSLPSLYVLPFPSLFPLFSLSSRSCFPRASLVASLSLHSLFTLSSLSLHSRLPLSSLSPRSLLPFSPLSVFGSGTNLVASGLSGLLRRDIHHGQKVNKHLQNEHRKVITKITHTLGRTDTHLKAINEKCYTHPHRHWWIRYSVPPTLKTSFISTTHTHTHTFPPLPLLFSPAPCWKRPAPEAIARRPL